MVDHHHSSFGNELLKGIAISALAIFLLSHLPLISSFTIMLVPLPILFYFYRLGRPAGILILISSLFMVHTAMSMLETQEAFITTFLLGILGFLLSETLRFHYRIEKTVMITTVAFIAGIFTFIFIHTLSQNLSFGEILKSYLTRYLETNIEIYRQIDPTSEQIAIIKENSARIVHTLLLLLPSLSVVSTAVVVLVNLLAAKKLLHKLALPAPDFGELHRWRVPEKLIWLLIASGFMLLIPATVAKVVGLNILIFLLFLYVLNGMALAEYYLDQFKISFLFRLFFYLMVFFLPYLLIMVCIFGLIDIWIDFRNRPKLQAS